MTWLFGNCRSGRGWIASKLKVGATRVIETRFFVPTRSVNVAA